MIGLLRAERVIMSATIVLVRQGTIGFELRRRPFSVTVDGKEVASLEIHGTVELPVEPGQHTLQLTDGRYSSRSVSFVVDEDDEVVSFRCHSPTVWPWYVASLIVPSLGIRLRRQ
jgi:hypothetical protein